jgi:mannose-1-phosphate guanylyltransferase
MKAMILVGGKGTRLGALTEETPKPMLPVGGKPLLEHTVELLKGIGVTHIVMNPHHHGHKIIEHFGSGHQHGNSGPAILYSREPELLGTAGAVKRARHFFDNEPFLVLYGDNFYQVDLRYLVQVHESKPSACTIGLWYTKSRNPASMVMFNEQARVISFTEKPAFVEDDYTWMFGGAMMINPTILETIPENQFADFGHDIFPQWVRFHKAIHCCHYMGGLTDIGTPEGYATANRLVGE